jgi:multidrug resistance protein MdtO
MATAAQPIAPASERAGFATWFGGFLREELTPYPGRLHTVVRMTVAATITMILIMVFRLPGAALGAYYTLLLSRESPNATFQSASTVLLAYVLGAAYTLLGVLLFVDYPITHFLWVIVSIFLCFFVIKVTRSYVGAAAFAFIVTIAVPLWDIPLPTDTLLTSTLWAAGSVSVGLVVTVGVEYIFSLFDTRDEFLSGVSQRIETVGQFLQGYASHNIDHDVQKRITQFVMVGTSRLRQIVSHTPGRDPDAARRSSILSLAGRLVDLCASMITLQGAGGIALDDVERLRLRAIGEQISQLAALLTTQTEIPHYAPHAEHAPSRFPLLHELERTTNLLALSLSHSAPDETHTPDHKEPGSASIFLPDALTNPDHWHYALRGCLAASLCYVIFNAVAWRGLATSLATCVITALTTVGSSRQKQILRIAGAIVGGLVFGIGAQVFVLPLLDTISGFTVLFAVVTLISAWIGTSSTRLSYFGLQIALAFYLINLQEFYPQTNLAIARDRVMGVGLGLIMMWLVFDTLGTRPAAEVMAETFAENLRLLADLADPWRDGERIDLKKARTLRDRISANFAAVNAQSDAVLFEVGPSRHKELALRERLLAWQPTLRSLYFILAGLLQYRSEIVPQELPPAIRQAQQEFDRRAAAELERLATCFHASKEVPPPEHLREAWLAVQQAVQQSYPVITPRAQGVLALTSNMAEILEELEQQMRPDAQDALSPTAPAIQT